MTLYPDNPFAAASQFLQMKYAVLPSPTGAKYPSVNRWPAIAEHQTYKSGLNLMRGHSGNLTLVNRGNSKAIDFDNRDLFDYCRQHMPDTWQFNTPHGGRIAFRSKIRDREMQALSVAGVIEWKGKGGAFIAPPSIDVHGNRYEDLTPRKLAWYDDLPAAVIDAFKQAAADARKDGKPQPATIQADDDGVIIEAGKWPRSVQTFITAPPAQNSHSRNASLFAASLHAHWAGFTADEIEVTLSPTAYAIGLSVKEVRATIRSACRYSPPTDRALNDYCEQWLASINYSGRAGGAVWAVAAACANIATLANTSDGLGLPVRRVAVFASISKNTAAKHLHTLQQQHSITPTTDATALRFTTNNKGQLTTTTTKRHDDANTYSLTINTANKKQDTGAGIQAASCLSVPSKSLYNPCPPADALFAAHDAANMRAMGKRSMQILATMAKGGAMTPAQIAARVGTSREYVQRLITVSASGRIGKLARYVVPLGNGLYELAAGFDGLRADLDAEAMLRGYKGRNSQRQIAYQNESDAWKERKPDNERIAEKKRLAGS